MKSVIIADSGGTKTDWCKVDAQGNQIFLHTRSYHPAQWTEEIAHEQREFWLQHPDWLQAELYFFGAGCFRKEPSSRMRLTLQALGFEQVRVSSDVHAAAWAALGKSAGWVAIMGTGSVLIEWDGAEVKQIVGGLGHESGDEGSGYRFGRMVYDRFLLGNLSPEQRKSFERCVDIRKIELSRAELMEKSAMAAIAKALSEEASYDPIHIENIEEFIHSVRAQIPDNTPLHFVGTYAWHRRDDLARILSEHGLAFAGNIEKPIGRLVEQRPFFVD